MGQEGGWFQQTEGYEVESPSPMREYEGEMAVATEQEYHESPSSCRKWMLYALIGLSVVGIAAGVAVGVSSNSEQVASPAMAPTVGQSTPGPTPTTANEVADAIFAVARFDGAEFQDPNSYQSKALTWVMTQTLPAPQYANVSMEDQAVQLYALACIYYSTYSQPNDWTDFRFGEGEALPGWFSDLGWLETAGEVCEWHGITCNEQFRVSKIELDTNGLTGFFPPEVTLLKDSLTVLDLYSNLVHNRGDEGNAFLGELTNLEYLFFGTTSFEYEGIPTHLGKLTKLKELDVSYSLYFGPIPEGMWGAMTDLNYFVMDGNAYNSTLPQDLITLPNLEFLYGGYSFLEGDLSFIPLMPKIFELWLDDNPGLSGSIPSTIGTATTLVSFSVTNCGLTGTIPSEMGLMTDMVQMWLFDNELSGTIPSEFGNMTKLKILNIQKNELNGTMPDLLCSRKTPFGQLEELEADCDAEIICADTCCTCCGEQCIET